MSSYKHKTSFRDSPHLLMPCPALVLSFRTAVKKLHNAKNNRAGGFTLSKEHSSWISWVYALLELTSTQHLAHVNISCTKCTEFLVAKRVLFRTGLLWCGIYRGLNFHSDSTVNSNIETAYTREINMYKSLYLLPCTFYLSRMPHLIFVDNKKWY